MQGTGTGGGVGSDKTTSGVSLDIRIEAIEGEGARALGGELLSLCQALFPGFAAGYLSGRLPHIAAPAAHVARDGTGRLVGFKLGYRRGETLFYSWLGGVHPDARRCGIAQRLMQAQHDWAQKKGYAFIETRTRADNNPMIILNLRSGFRVVGFEVDRAGIPVVTQRVDLIGG